VRKLATTDSTINPTDMIDPDLPSSIRSIVRDAQLIPGTSPRITQPRPKTVVNDVLNTSLRFTKARDQEAVHRAVTLQGGEWGAAQAWCPQNGVSGARSRLVSDKRTLGN